MQTLTTDKIMEKLPSIPEYFRKFVDPSIDLDKTHNIPCPFHREQSGKSFTYSAELGKWRCWGACHAGGDVIDLHRLNHRYASRDEAKKSIYKLYGLTVNTKPSFERTEPKVNELDVERRSVYSQAIHLAKTVDDYVELDYIMSQVPYDVDTLKQFIQNRSTM